MDTVTRHVHPGGVILGTFGILWAVAAVGAALSVVLTSVPGLGDGPTVVITAVPAGALATVLLVRLVRCSVRYGPSGIRVRNPFHTYLLAWEEVRSVSVGGWHVAGRPSPCLRLKTGRRAGTRYSRAFGVPLVGTFRFRFSGDVDPYWYDMALALRPHVRNLYRLSPPSTGPHLVVGAPHFWEDGSEADGRTGNSPDDSSSGG
jgi:hypothetical protein